MIRFATLFAVAALAVGCAASESDAGSSNQDIIAPLPGQSLPVTYSVDLRPVDGAYTAVTIVEETPNKWRVVKSTEWYDRIAGKPKTETQALIVDGRCTFDARNGAHCSKDDRPVDGPLTLVDIVPNPSPNDASVKFDATLERRIDTDPKGPHVEPYVETIATGLTRYVPMP